MLNNRPLVPEAQCTSRSIVEGIAILIEIIKENKWGRKANVKVTDRFISEDRIEGQWIFEETATLPRTKNCVTKDD